jgi:hypothetical protein
MNLEAKGEGMGILYRIVLGDAYYRAPDTYAVADNAGDNSSSTADEDMQTYEQGYSDGLEFEKSNPSDQRRQDFESFLNYFLREGICTEDYANGVHDGLAAGLNPSVTSATATTTPNTPTPSNGGDIATFTPKYSSATSSTPAPNSGGNTASGGTLDEKLQSANDNRNRAESNDAIAYKIWFDFVSMDIDTTGMIDKYSRREKPEYESYIVFGETVNGLPNGFCYLAKSDSTVSYGVDVKNIIAGTFVNGKLNGEGVMRVFNNENNVEIKGTFANGLPAGSISIKDDKNGSEYAGGYKNGHFNGVGYFKDKVGNIWSGEWENGKLNGYASLYDVVNKTEYLGYFVDGMPQGAGYVSNIFADNISAEAAIGEAWGYFDGFEMTEVYGYHELTLEEKTAFMKAAAENAAKVNDMINATLSEANAIISAGNAASAEIWSDSSASTDQFKANLKESQTFSQVNLIPNYSGIINPDGSFIIGY